MSKKHRKSRKKKMDLVEEVVKEPEVVQDKKNLQEKPDNAKK